MKNKSRIIFYGGAGSVTGANFLFDTGEKKVLVDCGLTHGKAYCEQGCDGFEYDPAGIDILFVTHAHADHIGKIPKLVKDGFRGVIYSTPATKDLSEVMFDDALMILAQEARKMNRLPLYEKEDVSKALSLWKELEYHEKFEMGDDVSTQFLDAGHILGSTMIEFARDGRKIIFTGDLGNSPALLLPDTEKISSANFLLMESVYGDRNHEERDKRTEKLAETLIRNYKKRGTLLIPAFALQRAQILLYEIKKLVESGKVPEMPVYFDAPLATRVTEVFYRYKNLFNDQVKEMMNKGDDIFDFPKFVTVHDARKSRTIDKEKNPKVIIASSGMSIGGRVRLHERKLLEGKKNTILFIGYQAMGTLGRKIQEGRKKVFIDGKKIHVRASIETIRGYSGHKDSDHLVEFVSDTADTLEKVFVAMGEPQSANFLAERIGKKFGIETFIPKIGDDIEIHL